MNIRTSLSIAGKEILGYLTNPASYIALVVFLAVWEFLFFRGALLVGEASVRILYDYLPWTFMFFAAAVTMGAIAQEKSEGTVELILTHPVRESELIFGKFLGSLAFAGCALLFAVPVAASFAGFGTFDWGAFTGQLLSGFMLAAAFVSVGICCSALAGNQIAALLTSLAVSFFFVMAGTDLVTGGLPLSAAPILSRLSLASHADSMARGVIDTRDVWYFVSFTAVFLLVSWVTLLRAKYGNRKDRYRPAFIVTALLIAIAVVTNILGERIPGRIDLTAGHRYSLSSATVTTLSGLRDIVTVTLYESGKLPSQLQPTVRDVRDVLGDYRTAGRGNIQVIVKDPGANPATAQEAASRGIREVQFNVIGNEEFQVKTGYFGLVVSYGDNHEAIPYIQTADDLEYQLTGFVTKLTSKTKKTVAFLTGHGEKSPETELTALSAALSRQYAVKAVTVDDADPYVATGASVLIVAGPTRKLSEPTKNAVASFVRNGGTLIAAVDGYAINAQLLTADPAVDAMGDLLGRFGISVRQGLVYDVRANETVQLGQSGMNIYVPYPYWIRSTVAGDAPAAFKTVTGVTLPWASPVSVDGKTVAGLHASSIPLLSTTRYAGVVTSPSVSIVPNSDAFPLDSPAAATVAAGVIGSAQSDMKGNVIVIGDSEFMGNQFLVQSPGNTAFMDALLSFVTGSQSLSGIRMKTAGTGRLLFTSDTEASLVKYGNLALTVILPLSVGAMVYVRRRAIRTQPYRRNAS